MNAKDELTALLTNHAKLVAMLAPSFPIMYRYPDIIQTLKHIGFSHIVEVTVGAKKTNEALVALFQNDPKRRVITSPCASFTRYIKLRHPTLIPYLSSRVDSPMIATARIVREKYPEHQPVFIGPCFVKKAEAHEEYPELNILVVTYAELDQITNNIAPADTQAKFDISESSTRMYPTDGGLTNSSGIRKILKEEEIRIVSGYKACETALSEFEKNPTIRLLDVLFCDGGCIMGPGIHSPLTKEERRQKIVQYTILAS